MGTALVATPCMLVHAFTNAGAIPMLPGLLAGGLRLEHLIPALLGLSFRAGHTLGAASCSPACCIQSRCH